MMVAQERDLIIPPLSKATTLGINSDSIHNPTNQLIGGPYYAQARRKTTHDNDDKIISSSK